MLKDFLKRAQRLHFGYICCLSTHGLHEKVRIIGIGAIHIGNYQHKWCIAAKEKHSHTPY
jgi:hypothetical protein